MYRCLMVDKGRLKIQMKKNALLFYSHLNKSSFKRKI